MIMKRNKNGSRIPAEGILAVHAASCTPKDAHGIFTFPILFYLLPLPNSPCRSIKFHTNRSPLSLWNRALIPSG